ncbi:alpha-L-arabinofuranosidase [Striga asiatica]|uniref:non-reducing end alpha-L-arabinofuranosidase n=1 Tax=Striga asiatica TaxID=4170 RepID=A0A5A7NZQ6_STRAF|nr:alpha-L-arabinofuranosidase [Striga asiatica]
MPVPEDYGQSLSATEVYRSFEAGGQNTPSNISPWIIIGNESSIIVSTDRSSCFDRNKIALKLDVLCEENGVNMCPVGGVGVYNPGFWGMNIEQGKIYKVSLYVRSSQPIELSVSLFRSNGLQMLATAVIYGEDVKSWSRKDVLLVAKGTDSNSRLHLTTSKNGTIWLDQVSVMPLSTHEGHGFRQDLFKMLADLKPGFIRFPGISINEQVDTSTSSPFVQDILDALEFARGDPNSKWGSVRAEMGRSEPFDLRYVAVGNQECNYMKFYNAIKTTHPDIKIISNCDGSVGLLDHPADLYDFHVYTSANSMFSMAHNFDRTSRDGPKAFVSEYAVTGNDAGRGSLLKALAEAGFLMGLERNSDVVEMASNAPLFVNDNDRSFNADAIVFDSSRVYGTPSYWMQHFFKESNNAILLDSSLQSSSSNPLIASAISWKNTENNKNYLRIKVVNFGSNGVRLSFSVQGLDNNLIDAKGSTITTLTSSNVMDENSFDQPQKVAPVVNPLKNARTKMDIILPPYSLTSIDLLRKSNVMQPAEFYDVHASM